MISETIAHALLFSSWGTIKRWFLEDNNSSRCDLRFTLEGHYVVARSYALIGRSFVLRLSSLFFPMASSTAALVSTPTAEVFNHSLPLPLGLVVPLADTDIVGPSSAPLLLHLDIPLSRRKAPATTATSPYPKTNAVPTAGNRAKPRSPTPIRRDTSPLSEDETYPPPSAARITIPRPVGVQRSVEAYLTVPLTQLLAIKVILFISTSVSLF